MKQLKLTGKFGCFWRFNQSKAQKGKHKGISWKYHSLEEKKEGHKKVCRAFHKRHKKERNLKRAEYYKTHAKEEKERKREWMKNNKEKYSEYQKERRKKKPIKHREYDKRHEARRRELGFIPINEPFEGREGHHLDDDFVFYIPKELHRSVWHNLRTNQGMEEINNLAFQWLQKDTFKLS